MNKPVIEQAIYILSDEIQFGVQWGIDTKTNTMVPMLIRVDFEKIMASINNC